MNINSYYYMPYYFSFNDHVGHFTHTLYLANENVGFEKALYAE